MTEKLDSLMHKLSAQEQSILLNELHRIASRYMNKERNHHTLQATALVNEAYISLSSTPLALKSDKHMIVLVARQMRRILVDHARQKLSQKRHAELATFTLSDMPSNDLNPLELIHIDRLLSQLNDFDERAAKIYELRLFSGLQNKEIASLLEVSVATVERDAKLAKAWLHSELYN